MSQQKPQVGLKVLTKDGVILQEVVTLQNGEQYQHLYDHDEVGLLRITVSKLHYGKWKPICKVEYDYIDTILWEIYSSYEEDKWVEDCRSIKK